MRDRRQSVPPRPAPSITPAGSVRIIGGKLRGSVIPYNGDQRTRPMKDRVREAIFNLIGADIHGMTAIDLFAGTGAVGLEALSRGAARVEFIERHFPTAKEIRRIAEHLGVADQVSVTPGDTFVWARRLPDLGDAPWAVFCSPPYELYETHRDGLLTMLTTLITTSPPGSLFVVEADERFDMNELPQSVEWDVRTYFPAIVAVGRKS